MKPGKIAGIGAGVFILDEAVKQTVEETFDRGEERKIAGGRAVLRKVYNEGAALGLFGGHPKVLRRVSLAVCAAALLYDAWLLKEKRRPVRKLGMMLFTGGAFSNLFDRLARGRVIDYVGFETSCPRLRSITFNLGDLAIVSGMILVMISSLKKSPLPDRE